eukprot:TRINITY_DN855_c0_g1_i2.p2 TRINITY_DN855_c0_g1~~TRINITY_DN855_c0_g1_i2.p2  ORF type:complete len:169 (+),score=17.10 TRINITY_DN855_c0_g1_i2:129-635(+)
MCIRDRRRVHGMATKGLKRGTRNKFARPFRYHGDTRIAKLLTKYRLGDYVDIKVNGAFHRGMPYKFYHGKTGKVFNINPRSLGVIVHKQVRNRLQEKRIHVRIEHLQKSKCRDDFLKRIQENDKKKHDAKKQNIKISTKRLPEQPREAHFVKAENVEFQNPKVFLEVF